MMSRIAELVNPCSQAVTNPKQGIDWNLARNLPGVRAASVGVWLSSGGA